MRTEIRVGGSLLFRSQAEGVVWLTPAAELSIGNERQDALGLAGGEEGGQTRGARSPAQHGGALNAGGLDHYKF